MLSEPHRMRSYHHRGGESPLLGATIPEHFSERVRRHGRETAVIGVPQGRRLSYAELAGATDELARGLLAMGFRPGDRIGIWSTNNVEWLLLQMATARMGAVLVNINPAYRPQELAYALGKSAVQGLFTIPAFRGSDYAAMLRELVPELDTGKSNHLDCGALPALERVVVYDPRRPLETERPAPGFTTWGEVIDLAGKVSTTRLEQVTSELDRDDPINIQYTSGTTGFPKAVVLTHHNILNNAWFAAHELHLAAGERLAVSVPFYHCFGMVLSNLLCLSVGACIVIPCEHFDPGAVLNAIETEFCVAVHGVPTMFIAMLDHPEFAGFDLSTLRTGIMAGAPCPPELLRRVMSEMHCREILIGYGQTEASPLTHLTSRDDSIERRVETVGRNLPHQEVKIVDVESRATADLGDIGEVCFRGYHVMQGYYGDPEATQEAIDRHGWLASGDLGTMDAEGYLRITGRLKEMIIRGGENIYPREIEDLLFTHPKVAEAAVFGVPDEFYGEQIAAWIQLQDGETATPGEIRDFLKARLAHFKIPGRIRFVDEFPMTVTGKLRKFHMRDMEIRSTTRAGATQADSSSG